MSRNELLTFIADIGKVRFDEQFTSDFIFPKDFDEKKLTSFLRQSGLTRVGSIGMMLCKLGAAKNVEGKVQLNNAGVLFLYAMSSLGVYVPSENTVCKCKSAKFINPSLVLSYPI